MAGILIAADPDAGTRGLSPDVRLTSIKVGTASGTTFTNLPKGGKQLNVLAPGTSIVSLRDEGSYLDAT